MQVGIVGCVGENSRGIQSQIAIGVARRPRQDAGGCRRIACPECRNAVWLVHDDRAHDVGYAHKFGHVFVEEGASLVGSIGATDGFNQDRQG